MFEMFSSEYALSYANYSLSIPADLRGEFIPVPAKNLLAWESLTFGRSGFLFSFWRGKLSTECLIDSAPLSSIL